MSDYDDIPPSEDEITERRSDPGAERALLAACLESKTAREEARKHITGRDFDQPVHETIWDAMARLDRHDKAVDFATVASVLSTNQAATRVLINLTGGIGLPDHVGTYAEIIRAWATRRRIESAARSALTTAMNPATNPVGLAASVAATFAGIRDNGATEDDFTALTLAELLAEDDDEPDWLIPGLLERRDRLMLTGEEGLGKALAIDTPIPTPNGWTTMGDLAVGDEVFRPDGTPARILAATGVMTDRPCYRLTFSDDSTIVADENHLWQTRDHKSRHPTAPSPRTTATGYEPAVRTTREVAKSLYTRDGHTPNHSIDTCAPLAYPAQEQLIDPYVLGAWLSNGSSKASYITTHPNDREILDRIHETWPTQPTKNPYLVDLDDGKGSSSRDLTTFLGCLREIGVYGNKHIPESYLRGSIEQRIALLQGLMDTNGTIGTGVTPVAEFSVVNERLARDVHELLLGLGIKVKWAEGPARLESHVVGTRYSLTFQTALPVFHLSRKAEQIVPPRPERYRRRYITAADPIDPVPVRCIQIDHEDGMFLAGRECIPTHNSHMLRQMALHASAGMHPFDSTTRFEPIRSLILDCENTWGQVRRKLRGAADWVTHMGAEPKGLMVDCLPRIDITRDRDLSRIHQLIDVWNPDLVVIGPLYRLIPRAIQTDDEAAPLLAALDTLRDRGCALLMEAHAGHAIGKGGQRDLRPRGSSALLGWPEFGFGMRGIGAAGYADFVQWRGPREERPWPDRFKKADGHRWLPHGDTYGYDQGSYVA